MRSFLFTSIGSSVLCALVLACGSAGGLSGGDESTDASDGSLGVPGSSDDDAPYEAATFQYDASFDSPDWAALCMGPLPDAGFTSVSDIDASAWCSSNRQVSLSTVTCQGYRILWVSPPGPTGLCSNWYLFDAESGALVAAGGDCIDGNTTCTGAEPGFVFPYQCFASGGWPPYSDDTDLCADAAMH